MRGRIRVEPDARVLAGLVLAPPSGMTVAALAAHTPHGEAYVAIHCKTAWQADPPLLERTMREDAWAYRLTDAGRAYVHDRVEFPERTAPELPAPEVYVGIDMATHVAGATFFLVTDNGLERIPDERIHVIEPNDPRRCPVCGGRDLYYAWTGMRQACTTCERTVELLPDRLALQAGVASPA